MIFRLRKDVKKFMLNVEYIKGRFLRLVHKGPKNIHRVINESPIFPFFFLVQALWSCYVVKLSRFKKLNSNYYICLMFLSSLLLTFVPSILLHLLFDFKLELLEYKSEIVFFSIIFVSINWFPYDLFFKITNYFYYFLALFYGIRQERFYVGTFKRLKVRKYHENDLYLYVFASSLTSLDFLIGIVYSRLTDGMDRKICSFISIFRTFVFCFLHYLLTNENAITKYISLYSDPFADVMLAFLLGTFNARTTLYE